MDVPYVFYATQLPGTQTLSLYESQFGGISVTCLGILPKNAFDKKLRYRLEKRRFSVFLSESSYVTTVERFWVSQKVGNNFCKNVGRSHES